jgi:hypothetical protein
MFRGASALSCLSKAVSVLLSVLFSLWVMTPVLVMAGNGNESISERMERVNVLRARGEFQSAIEILNEIIREHAESDQVLRSRRRARRWSDFRT